MTPDPITTAREALPYVYHPGVSPKLWAESLAKVNAALDYAEKLKAERDEAIFERDFYKTSLELADNHAKEVLRPKITRLTSQLEQAERFAELISDGFEEHDYSDCADDEPMVIDATAGDMRRAFQWIKDLQAKGEG